MKKNVYLIILTLVTVICIIGGTCYHLVGWGVSFLSHLPFASFYSDSDDTESSDDTEGEDTEDSEDEGSEDEDSEDEE